ncbi:MAG: hypothetical protein NVS1B13_11750 [Flavisolibacter sp.]
MENIFYVIASSLMQKLSAPSKFKSYLIGDTGCSALFLSQYNSFEKIKTKTGDDLYYGEFTDRSVTYGIICVSLIDHYSIEESEALLINYMGKLKKPFSVLHDTGIRGCANWNNAHVTTLTEYWQDKDKKDWKVKGLINGQVLAILYVKNIGQGDVKKQDFYLDSFHFKAPSLL